MKEEKKQVLPEKIPDEMNDDGGNIYFRFARGAVGYSGANVKYILREGALESSEGLYLQNYEGTIGQVRQWEKIEKIKVYLVMANKVWEEMSLRRVDWHPQAATYHWMVMSFLKFIPTEQAREMASKYLKEVFPKAKAIAAVHQNTPHTHIHVHLVNRTEGGLAERISYHKWRQLDEYWGAIFGAYFGQAKLEVHLAKKKETKEYKRGRYEGREVSKPARYQDGKSVEQRWEERTRRAMWGVEYEERGVNRNQQSVAREDQRIESRAERVGRDVGANEEGARRIRELDDALQRADRVTEQVDRRVQQTLATGIRVVELFRGGVEIEQELGERNEKCDEENASNASKGVDRREQERWALGESERARERVEVITRDERWDWER